MHAIMARGDVIHLRAGPARQFASLCAIFCAGVAWVCLVADQPLGARIMLVSESRNP